MVCWTFGCFFLACRWSSGRERKNPLFVFQSSQTFITLGNVPNFSTLKACTHIFQDSPLQYVAILQYWRKPQNKFQQGNPYLAIYCLNGKLLQIFVIHGKLFRPKIFQPIVEKAVQCIFWGSLKWPRPIKTHLGPRVMLKIHGIINWKNCGGKLENIFFPHGKIFYPILPNLSTKAFFLGSPLFTKGVFFGKCGKWSNTNITVVWEIHSIFLLHQ